MLVPQTVVLDGFDPEVASAFEAALKALEAAGVRLTRVPVPEIAEAFEIANTVSNIAAPEGWRIWGKQIEANPGVMYDRIEKRFRTGMTGTPEKDRQALEGFARLSKAVQARMAEHGPMVMPASAILPPPAGRLLEDEPYFTERNLLGLRNTRLGNLLTMSALTVPTAAPMVGLMLVAGPMQEDLLLALGQTVERTIA
jgi:aspartyl-tRNA(Asn)/glutamyl-tRNA(Gln) amidotransferase subunit A